MTNHVGKTKQSKEHGGNMARKYGKIYMQRKHENVRKITRTKKRQNENEIKIELSEKNTQAIFIIM